LGAAAAAAAEADAPWLRLHPFPSFLSGLLRSAERGWRRLRDAEASRGGTASLALAPATKATRRSAVAIAAAAAMALGGLLRGMVGSRDAR
jgi:hypothetical protein